MSNRPNWRKALRDSIYLRWALMAKGEEPQLTACSVCTEHDKHFDSSDCVGCIAEDGPLCRKYFGAWRDAKTPAAKRAAARGMVKELTRLLKIEEAKA